MKITSPSQAHTFFRSRINGEVEEFWAAALNAEKAVIAAQCLFRGTVDHCLFHPRDLFRFAYLHNASALIVAHNHPSGSAEPSPEDVQITAQLLQIAIILQMPLVDHLILGAATRYFSFLERGKLTTGSLTKDPVSPCDQ